MVVIDMLPYLSCRLATLLAVSTNVLILTKAGLLVAMAIKAPDALLKQSTQQRPDLKAGIVLTMISPHSMLNDAVKSVLADYHGLRRHILNTL